MARSVFFAMAVILTVSLGGCSGLDRTIDELTHGGDIVSPPAQPMHERIYFASTDELPVYAQPSASSQVVGYLGRHERVARSGLDQGFAYVATGRDLHGWVDNVQLLTNLPPSQGRPMHSPLPAAAPSDPTPTEAASVVPASNNAPAEPAAPAQPAAAAVPVADPEPAEPAPEMLNPF